jgi:hypothetical protein
MILPETYEKLGGICMKCHKAKPSPIMTEISTYIDMDYSPLVTSVYSDVRDHVLKLHESGIEFYGYSVLPGDPLTQPDPASIGVAYNRESDVDDEHKNDTYYRYSVDEWQNYELEGFSKANEILRKYIGEFNDFCEKYGDDVDDFDYDSEFYDRINHAILEALVRLKEDGVLKESAYLVIWFSDSNNSIIEKSVEILNTKEIYKEFLKVFST